MRRIQLLSLLVFSSIVFYGCRKEEVKLVEPEPTGPILSLISTETTNVVNGFFDVGVGEKIVVRLEMKKRESDLQNLLVFRGTSGASKGEVVSPSNDANFSIVNIEKPTIKSTENPYALSPSSETVEVTFTASSKAELTFYSFIVLGKDNKVTTETFRGRTIK